MLKRLIFIVAAIVLAWVPPAFAARPVEDYGRLPGIEMVALSPSGERYAVAGEVGGKRQLLVLAPGGKLITSAGLNDEKVRDIEWAGEDYVLVTLSRTYNLTAEYGYRFEIAQVGILNLKTGKLVFAFSSGEARNGVWGQYGLRQIDGKWWGWFGGMAMEGAYLKSGHPDLYRIDLDTGKAVWIAAGGEGNLSRSWLLDDKGEILAKSEYLQSGRWRLIVRDERVMERDDPLSESTVIGQGRTPGTVLYGLGHKDGQDLYELAPGMDSKGELMFADRGKTTFRLIYDPWTSLLIGTGTDGERPAYNFFSPTHQQRARLVDRAFPGYRARLVSWTKDFSKAVVFTDGKDDSGTYWTVDFKTGKADALGTTYPTIKPADVAPAKLIKYQAGDGLEIEAVLTLPLGREAKNLPVVMLPHGGPKARDYTGFDWMAQAVASRGYAVLQPNFRGSSGYGDEFADAGKGEFGRKMQTDLSDGLKFLADQGIVDPKRACIFGASYGGYAALAGVTLQQGVYRCAVSYSGVTDLPGMVRYDGDTGGEDSRRYWRDYLGNDAAMRAVSPTRLAEKASAPILLIHGRDDTVVPYAQSRDMDRALERAGKPTQLITLDGEDHWLSKGATRTAMLKAAVEFIEKHNPPN